MTDQPDDHLADGRRDFNAAQYVIAMATGDGALVNEVARRLASYGEPGCFTDMFGRALHLIFEKTDLVELEPVLVAMRQYSRRLVARFGERLDTGPDDDTVDPAEIDAALRRLFGGEPGEQL